MNSLSPTTLVIDDFHPGLIQTLSSEGIEAIYKPDFDLSKDHELLATAEILVLRSKLKLTAELMSTLPNLKCIARGGAGMDNIDVDYAEAQHITLLNAPEGNRDAVAEHAIGLMLAISNQIPQAFEEVKNKQWRREANRGWEIGGKTIGIIGFGNTGSALAKKLSGFDAQVIAYDKYKKVDSPYATEVPLDQLLQTADIISFHVPLTQQTKGMIGTDLLSQMKDGVVLINTARGGICRLADVLLGIIGGKIKSYGTDVLENEKLSSWTVEDEQLFDDLLASNQVLITPHVAGWTHESYQKIAAVLAHKIIEYTMKVKNI